MNKSPLDDLVWNVIISSRNSGKFLQWNVFNNTIFSEQVTKALKKYKSIEEFAGRVKSWAMYCFWSKCEYEIILSHWPPNERFEELKIDVFDQLMLNFNTFVEYIWNSCKRTKQKLKETSTITPEYSGNFRTAREGD